MTEESALGSAVTGTPNTGSDSTLSGTPAPGSSGGSAADAFQQATVPTEQGGAAAPSDFILPDDDSDLRGQETNPHVKALLGMRNQLRQMSSDANNYRQQLAEKEQLEQRLNAVGGPEAAEWAGQLVNQLFGAEIDPMTGQARTDEYGVPVVNTQGFVETVAQQNWSTALDLTERLLTLPTSDGTPLLAHVLQRIGLDPNLIDTYRQINSAADAARFGAMDVHPVELENIPPEYHEVYKQMTAREREAVQDLNIDDATREQFLASKAQNLAWENFRQEQQQAIDRRNQLEAERQSQAIDRAGQQAAEQLYNVHANAIQQELMRVNWHQDPGKNQFMHNFILNGVANYVQTDPEVAPMLQRANLLVMQATRLHAMGDTMRSRQFQLHATQEARNIVNKARIYAMRAQQDLQQVMGLQPSTAEMARPVPNGNGFPGNNQNRTPQGMKSFTPEWYEWLGTQ
jgi:hypothetical protein